MAAFKWTRSVIRLIVIGDGHFDPRLMHRVQKFLYIIVSAPLDAEFRQCPHG